MREFPYRHEVGTYTRGQENPLAKGELELRGRRVDFAMVRRPVLVAATKDTITPPAARALMDLAGRAEKEYEELPGGHISMIAGRRTHQHRWPKLVRWLGDQCEPVTDQQFVRNGVLTAGR